SFSGFTNAVASGNTVFFKAGAAGGFTVTPASTDAESDVASYAYPALGTGFSNTGGAYTFGGSAATQSGAVTATNNAGVTSSGTTFTARADATAPTGGALTVNGGAAYLTSGTTVSIGETDFDEAASATESGIAGNTLTVRLGTLSNDTCSSYGSPTDITGQTSYTISSGDYTFDASAATQSGSVAATNGAGTTGSGTAFTAQADGNAPTGGALTVNGSSATSYLNTGTSVTISATNFAETQTAAESGL